MSCFVNFGFSPFQTSYQATHHHQSTTEQGRLVGAVARPVLPPALYPHEFLLHQHRHLNRTILRPSRTRPHHRHSRHNLVWYQTDQYHVSCPLNQWFSLLHQYPHHPLFLCHCHRLSHQQQHLYPHPMPPSNTAQTVIQTASTATAGPVAQLWQLQRNLPLTVMHLCH